MYTSMIVVYVCLYANMFVTVRGATRRCTGKDVPTTKLTRIKTMPLPAATTAQTSFIPNEQ